MLARLQPLGIHSLDQLKHKTDVELRKLTGEVVAYEGRQSSLGKNFFKNPDGSWDFSKGPDGLPTGLDMTGKVLPPAGAAAPAKPAATPAAPKPAAATPAPAKAPAKPAAKAAPKKATVVRHASSKPRAKTTARRHHAPVVRRKAPARPVAKTPAAKSRVSLAPRAT